MDPLLQHLSLQLARTRAEPLEHRRGAAEHLAERRRERNRRLVGLVVRARRLWSWIARGPGSPGLAKERSGM